MTDPCGTPERTGAEAELSPSTATLYWLLFRKFLIQSKILFLMKEYLSFNNSRL